jgi:hypothetical protein
MQSANNMSTLFIYVIDRDFGFAPNPFHGVCTLATCKPKLRNSAKVGDWIIGVGGTKLKATGKCIFGMQVSRKITFNEYWSAPEFRIKKPVRNGSKTMMVGDNIYHRPSNGEWVQADSHHSNCDGTTNQKNLETDTSKDVVLVSNKFLYFGNSAPLVPKDLFTKIEYRNWRGHRRFKLEGGACEVVEWLVSQNNGIMNRVLSDPFNFEQPGTRYNPDPE